VSRGVLRNHAEAVLADAYYKAVERGCGGGRAASRDLPRWLPVYPRPIAIRRPLYGVMPNEAKQRRRPQVFGCSEFALAINVSWLFEASWPFTGPARIADVGQLRMA